MSGVAMGWRRRAAAAAVALWVLGSRLAAQSPDPQAELRQAMERFTAGDTAGAERALQELARRYPETWQIRLALGRVLIGRKRPLEALPHLESAASRAPDEFDTHSTLGQAYALAKRLPEAEREFRIALELRPADPLSHFNLGRIFLLQEQYAQALPEFEQALSRTTEAHRRPMMHQNLAAVLRALRRPSQAVPHLEEYLRARPEDVEARLQLASLQFDLSAYDASLASVEEALERDARQPDALYLKGMLCKIKGRNDDAIASFRAALGARSDFTRARYQLATVLFEAGRDAQAEEPLRLVLEAEPEHPNAHYLMSTVLRRLGRESEADAELAIHNRIAEEQRARGRTVVAGPEWCAPPASGGVRERWLPPWRSPPPRCSAPLTGRPPIDRSPAPRPPRRRAPGATLRPPPLPRPARRFSWTWPPSAASDTTACAAAQARRRSWTRWAPVPAGSITTVTVISIFSWSTARA
jgi:tetratricopeptide (TPR) repeat protein